jgi:predicted acyl esterase
MQLRAKNGDVALDLELLLTRGGEGGPPRFGVADIQCETVHVPMRDGTRLATDLYFPPQRPAPVIAIRTPYLRNLDKYVSLLMTFARRGYVAIAQDCRGTGQSEPQSWDYYMFESEDGYDLVEWITQQEWFGGFIGSCGGSYAGQTQWPMATHPAMSTIVPHVSGLGIGFSTVHLHMFCNAYARAMGRGEGKIQYRHFSEVERLVEPETMSTGYFNEPLRSPLLEAGSQLWAHYCSLPSAGRAEFVKQAMGTQNVSILEVEALSDLFGHQISHDAHTIPHTDPAGLCRTIKAPPRLMTGWYDWCLNDAFATFVTLRREGREDVASRARMIITPHAHATLGYREGIDEHPELQLPPGVSSYSGVLLRWYQAVREGTTDSWPTVTYYLMGANEWCVADDWPVPEANLVAFYLGPDGTLTTKPPERPCEPDRYVFDPVRPTPTLGGSIVSYLYPPGSVDVSELHARPDVLVFTTPPLEHDLDVVGPLRMILYASSSALDTDFAARLSDVFPDGRAIQLQNGMLRARYRGPEPELLEPGRIYRFEIDLWATANRFRKGHRLRIDISSADFPRFDRNSNRGGEPGPPIAAVQAIYRDPEHPSHVLLPVYPTD